MGDDSTERVAKLIVQNVAELPDRTSPEDWPEAMLVTSDEMFEIARAAIASMRAEILEGPELIEAILGYGGRCRDCADSDGMCLGSRLPCHPDDARKAIAHVLSAVAYYREHPEFVRSLSPPVHSVPE